MTKADIEKQLNKYFKPHYLNVIDDSDSHRSHRGTSHTENTHFIVTIISDTFQKMTLIQRHRAVNNVLKDAFSGTLHALKITAKTPEEWSQ